MKFKKILITSLILLGCNLSFAGTGKLNIVDLENVNSQKFESKSKDFSPQEKEQIEIFITQNNFGGLYEYLKNVKVSGDFYIKFLDNKKDLGIIPLYWLMADYYSFQPNATEATHFWLSIALIMTEQDSHLCVDQSAKYAAQQINHSFPNPSTVISKSPQYTNIIMPKVKFFIKNLKTRINPVWACSFGNRPVHPTENPVANKSNWDEGRETILNKFMKNYNN
jgi:hypothetical protein